MFRGGGGKDFRLLNLTMKFENVLQRVGLLLLSPYKQSERCCGMFLPPQVCRDSVSSNTGMLGLCFATIAWEMLWFWNSGGVLGPAGALGGALWVDFSGTGV